MKKVVQFENVFVSFDDKIVLENINFEITERDIVIIVGPNGSGKTTLLKVITGQIKPDKGTAKVFGEDCCKKQELIGYVPQHHTFDYDFPVSVLDVVLMGRYKKIGLFRKPDNKDIKIAEDSLEKVGMLDYKDQQIGKLSGGQQQRVFIARALSGNPSLLLLDEATTGVDAATKDKFFQLIRNLKTELTLTVILVSHELEVIPALADKVICLNKKLFYHGKAEKVFHGDSFKKMYGCELELFMHGKVPHRVVENHKSEKNK